MEGEGVVSLMFHELSKIFSRYLCIAEIILLMRISSWNFVCVPTAMLWAHIQSFSLKFSPWMWFLVLYIFARLFWRPHKTLMKQPPDGWLLVPVVSDGSGSLLCYLFLASMITGIDNKSAEPPPPWFYNTSDLQTWGKNLSNHESWRKESSYKFHTVLDLCKFPQSVHMQCECTSMQAQTMRKHTFASHACMWMHLRRELCEMTWVKARKCAHNMCQCAHDTLLNALACDGNAHICEHNTCWMCTRRWCKCWHCVGPWCACPWQGSDNAINSIFDVCRGSVQQKCWIITYGLLLSHTYYPKQTFLNNIVDLFICMTSAQLVCHGLGQTMQ